MDIRTELVKLYCQHPTGAIENRDGRLLLAAFGAATRDQLMAIPGYREDFGLVSECAAIIDAFVKKHPVADVQARESLRLLRQMVDEGKPEKQVHVMCELVEGRLRKSWPPEKQAFYDQKKEILEWRDYFVSYTNRDAPTINQEFRGLIKSCLGAAPKREDLEINHLARVIARHLGGYQQLSGFFDENDLRVGENIEERVERYCTRVFALVQLIEPLTFKREPPRNWCFHEYRSFSENPAIVARMGDTDRHFFILIDSELGEIEPANSFPPFAAWIQRMRNVKRSHIDSKIERNGTLRVKTRDIAKEILKLRSEIINRWLS